MRETRPTSSGLGLSASRASWPKTMVRTSSSSRPKANLQPSTRRWRRRRGEPTRGRGSRRRGRSTSTLRHSYRSMDAAATFPSPSFSAVPDMASGKVLYVRETGVEVSMELYPLCKFINGEAFSRHPLSTRTCRPQDPAGLPSDLSRSSEEPKAQRCVEMPPGSDCSPLQRRLPS